MPNIKSLSNKLAHVIINDIPYKKSFDPFILRSLDSQEANIVLHRIDDGISQGLSNGLMLDIDSE